MDAKERIEDFSHGQFYILEPMYRNEAILKEFLQLAYESRKHKLNEWGRYVARRLITEIPKILEPENHKPALGHIERNRAGYVYLLKSTSGYYKIGHTGNPKNRLRTFNVKLPFEVEFECLIQCDDMRHLEKTLHNHFDNKRVNGEWFNLEAEDIKYIKGLAS